ncbi:MAG: hypothetical protein ACYSTS_19705 [Planctomycetota bacterium]
MRATKSFLESHKVPICNICGNITGCSSPTTKINSPEYDTDAFAPSWKYGN